MLGTRGVRLGVVKPGLYAMQVRALMEAARQRVADGGHPIVEIMIPLTVSREELALARSWVEEAVAEVAAEPDPRPSKGGARAQAKAGALEVTIGTMIETPRAALRAGEIAEVADFFSFGTNDLTQMTFGFSRDDVEGRMMGAYLELGLLPRNPFEVVDADGVGELVRLGTERGRATRPSLKVGVCGSTVGTPSRSPCSTTPGSTTSAVPRSGSPWPGWPPPRRCWQPSPRPRSRRPRRPARPVDGPGRPGSAGLSGRNDALPSSNGDTGRGCGPGAGGNRHRRPHRRARRAQAGRPPLDGPVPVPHREEPFVQRQRRGGVLLLLRLPGLGNAITFVRATEHLDFVDAVRLLADRAGVALHEQRRPGRTASGAPTSSTPWSGPSSGTTRGCCGHPTPGWPGTTCARVAMTGRSCASSASDGLPHGWMT